MDDPLHLPDLEAALAPSTSAATRGEAVAVKQWQWAGCGHSAWFDGQPPFGTRPDEVERRTLYTSPPAPAVESAQVKVKPLVWEHEGRIHAADWIAGTYIVSEQPDGSAILRISGYCVEPQRSIHGSPDAALTAAETHHESRIRASLDLATDAEG